MRQRNMWELIVNQRRLNRSHRHDEHRPITLIFKVIKEQPPQQLGLNHVVLIISREP